MREARVLNRLIHLGQARKFPEGCRWRDIPQSKYLASDPAFLQKGTCPLGSLARESGEGSSRRQ